MHRSLTEALVRSILEDPTGRPWRVSEIGLLGLRLDPAGEYRLHLWDPESRTDDDPIHDHPFDFASTVVVGEITNTIYDENPSGLEYQRHRYDPTDESRRSTDTIRLSGTSARIAAGGSYEQSAHELHGSTQAQGTVTILRRTFVESPTLTVCRPSGRPWISGTARPASADELRRVTAAALTLLG